MTKRKQSADDVKVSVEPQNKAATPDSAQVRPCPVCGKPAIAEMRPFCSKRCSDVDLHRWLGGSYAIPVVEDGLPGQDESDEEL